MRSSIRHRETMNEIGSEGMMGQEPMDVVEMMEQEHREILALFESYAALAASQAGAEERRAAADEIGMAITGGPPWRWWNRNPASSWRCSSRPPRLRRRRPARMSEGPWLTRSAWPSP